MRYFILYIFFASTFSLFAQQDSLPYPKDLSELSLEELLNTEVYSPTKSLQRIEEAPAIISSVQLNQLKSMGAVTLIDALKYIPSVEVSMGANGFYRVAIRGIRKDGNVLFLIDGQSLNDFYSGVAIFDLPIDFIDRIEIIRGPGSAIYGTSAMAGVINVITIKKNSIAVSGGINNTAKLGINLYKGKNKFSIATSLGGYLSSGANAKMDTDNVKNSSWSLTNGNKQFSTNRWNKDAYLNTNIAYDNLHLKLFSFARQQGMWAGPLNIATNDSKLFTNQFVASLDYDYKISDNVIITPKAYTNYNYHDFLIQETPNGYLSPVSGDYFQNGKQTRETYLSKKYGGEIDILIKANEHLNILTGSVMENCSVSNYSLTRNYQIARDINKTNFGNYDSVPYTQNGKQRTVFAYFLQANYKLKKLNITAGFRYDDYSDFGQSLNPRVGVAYKVNKIYNIKGLYGKAFRAPTFNELYDNTNLGNVDGVQGNVGLKPETISTYELANEFSLKKIFLKYNLFFIQNSNLIREYDPYGGGSIGIYQNIGNTRTYGNEVVLDVKLAKTLTFFANYSQYITQFDWNKQIATTFDINFYQKQPYYLKPLANMPTMRINAGVTWQFKNLELFVGGNYGNASYNNNRFYLEQAHYAQIPYYLQANANVRYVFSKKLAVNVTANNLGRKFSDPNESTNINGFGARGLIQPSASVLLNIIYSFQK